MTETLNLLPDHFARVHGAARLRVMRGTLWLTIDGEPDDRVLEAGACVALPRGSRALAQALDGAAMARLDVPHPAAAWWQPLVRAWQAATRRGAWL
jgi:quercetin dioxygenase-like cupin family protein